MATNPPASSPGQPSQVPTPSLAASTAADPSAGGTPAAVKTASPLDSLIGSLLPAAASSVTSGFAKGAAVFYASTCAFAIAVVDLKFNLGLGHSFDAGLIGAGLSALLGKAVSL